MLPPSPKSKEPICLPLGPPSKLNQGEKAMGSSLELSGRNREKHCISPAIKKQPFHVTSRRRGTPQIPLGAAHVAWDTAVWKALNPTD